MQRQNIPVPDNGKCLLLEQALGLKALVLQAEIDSIPVSDEDVDADIDNKIRYFVNQYGSKEIVEQIAGKSLFQLKEDFRQTFREQKLAQGERDKIVADNMVGTATDVDSVRGPGISIVIDRFADDIPLNDGTTAGSRNGTEINAFHSST